MDDAGTLMTTDNCFNGYILKAELKQNLENHAHVGLQRCQFRGDNIGEY